MFIYNLNKKACGLSCKRERLNTCFDSCDLSYLMVLPNITEIPRNFMPSR